MTRESFISNATSTNSSYPSTLSSFNHSALGLTDSPAQPQSQARTHLLAAHYTDQIQSIPSPASPSPWQRRRTRTPGPRPGTEDDLPELPRKTRLSSQTPSRSRPQSTTPGHSAGVLNHHAQTLRPSQSNSSLQSVAEGRVLESRRSADALDQQPARRTIVTQRSGLSQSQSFGDPQTPPRPSSRPVNGVQQSEGRGTPTRIRRSSDQQSQAQAVQTIRSREQVREPNGKVSPMLLITKNLKAEIGSSQQWIPGVKRLPFQFANILQR